MEERMFGKSMNSSSPEPSFYSVMLAATCFRRTALNHNPYAGGALRNIGREYLVKADCGVAHVQMSERSLAQGSRTGAKYVRRLPCKVA
jgi:hypothetical protein